MKKVSYLFLSFCMAVLFTSCKEEEQTVLSLDAFPTTTISGYLTYDAGYEESTPGVFVRKDKTPVKGQKVFVTVEYSQYGGSASGKYRAEALTNEAGMYTFTIPTTLNGVNAEVKAAPFVAKYRELIEENGNKKIVEFEKMYKLNTPVSFSTSETMPGLSFTKETTESYIGTEIEMAEEFKYKVTLKGVVKVMAEDTNGSTTYKGKENVQVKAYFTRGDFASEDKAVVAVIGTTSNIKGEYVLDLPIDDLQGVYYITVEALTFRGQFEDYTWGNPDPEIKEGFYSTGTPVTKQFYPEGFDGRAVEMGEIMMGFGE